MLSQKLRKIAESVVNRMAANKKFYVVRVNNDNADTYAAETHEKAQELAQLDPSDKIEVRTVEAPDAGAARLMWNKGKNAAKDYLAIEQIAADHLAGIEGGLAGVVKDLEAGVPIEKACGLGDSWQLPEGISVKDVEEEVKDQAMEAMAKPVVKGSSHKTAGETVTGYGLIEQLNRKLGSGYSIEPNTLDTNEENLWVRVLYQGKRLGAVKAARDGSSLYWSHPLRGGGNEGKECTDMADLVRQIKKAMTQSKKSSRKTAAKWGLKTKWGSDTVEVMADWGNASSQIEGDWLDRYQVADFRHNPKTALRAALEIAAKSDGMDLDDEETQDLIEEALDNAQRIGKESMEASRKTASDRQNIGTYMVTFPDGDSEGACDVTVYIEKNYRQDDATDTDIEVWTIHTKDDSGGSDDGPDTEFTSKEEAIKAAEEFIEEMDEYGGQQSEDWLLEQEEDQIGSPSKNGKWGVYWETVGDDAHLVERFDTEEQASAAANKYDRELHQHNPGDLLAGYGVRYLEKGEWVQVDTGY